MADKKNKRIITSSIKKTDIPSSVRKKMKKRAAANVARLPTFFSHPLYEQTNIMLPRETREINLWARHYYRTEPLVASCIDILSEFPIGEFINVIDDPAIQRMFDELAFDKIGLPEILLNISHEYWKLGNCFVMGKWAEDENSWERFVVLNPDYIRLESNPLAPDPVITMYPDDKLKAIINSKRPKEIFNQIPPEMRNRIVQGQPIPLHPKYTAHIAFNPSNYHQFGYPIMYRCFKALIYKDKVRGAQWKMLERYGTPLEIFALGEPGHPASQDDIQAFQDLLLQADQEQLREIIWNHPIKYEVTGGSGKNVNHIEQYNWIDQEILAGFGISKAMIMGEGPSFGTASVGYKSMMSRFQRFREKITRWIEQKVYRVFAEERKIVRKTKDGKEEIIWPNVRWERLTLDDDSSQKRFMKELADRSLISYKTVISTVGLDFETEQSIVQEEKKRGFHIQQQPQSAFPIGGEFGGGGLGEGGGLGGEELPLGTAPGERAAPFQGPAAEEASAENKMIKEADLEKCLEKLKSERHIMPFQARIIKNSLGIKEIEKENKSIGKLKRIKE